MYRKDAHKEDEHEPDPTHFQLISEIFEQKFRAIEDEMGIREGNKLEILLFRLQIGIAFSNSRG